MGCVDGLQLLRYCSTLAFEKKQLNDSLTGMSIDRVGQLIISHGGVSMFYCGICSILLCLLYF